VSGGQVTLQIYDDGDGLPPDTDPEDLFRPFFTTKRDGTGLGLSMVRKTVVYHDGQITADHGPWGGARFTITLPTELTERPPGAQTHQTLGGGGEG
jgi:signal transduction histidine kinase